MKNLDIKFEQWKKRKLYEGFLDGEEEKPVAAEDEAPAAETEESGDAGPDADMGGDDTSSEEAPAEEKAPEDTDVSEEEVEEETTEDDGLDDDFEGETKEETGVEDGDDGQMNELKDAIATLTTQLQTLTDQLKKTNGEESAEEKAPAEESETAEETAEPEEGAEETSEEGGEEGDEETSEEGGEETSEETSEEAPADETKSEAYNKYCKKGGILAENSGYLISYLNEGRYDKLEDKIMAVVNAKIRQRIDAAKTKLKTEAFNKKFGK